MNKYIRLLRIHQWVKNFFCFAGIFFGVHYDIKTIILAIIGFFSFCLISSTIYIINDICDKKADQMHTKKRFRPIASGEIPVSSAMMICIILGVMSLALSYYIGLLAFWLIMSYFVLNVLYTLRLKHVVILDVFIISSGFLLRLLMGSSALDIQPSRWIILCSIMITLFLGFAKRKSELLSLQDGNIARKVLNEYSHLMLDIFLSIMAACSIMCYCLFAILGSKFEHVWITVPFVIFGILRYLYLLLLRDCGQDTAKDLFRDIPILLSFIFFIMSYASVIIFLR